MTSGPIIDDFAALLAELDHRGITISVTPGGHVRLDAPAGILCPEITMQARLYYDQLVWTVRARGTGHVWCPCDQCSQPVLLNPALHSEGNGKQVWPRCYLTPGCEGRHRPPTQGVGP